MLDPVATFAALELSAYFLPRPSHLPITPLALCYYYQLELSDTLVALKRGTVRLYFAKGTAYDDAAEIHLCAPPLSSRPAS